jgi:colanic acid/amylovoran biosynthesis glycosyltransferase
MSRLTALHCFGSYLPITENWAYRLVSNQRDTERLVASPSFLDNDFYPAGMTYLRSPLQPRMSTSDGSLRAFLQRRQARLNAYVYPRYLRWLLRRRRIDVVHSHFAHVGWKFRDLARQLRAAHVVSFYGLDYVQMQSLEPAWKERLPRLFAQADLFVCEGPHGAGLLAGQGCPESKIQIGKLGVDPDSIPFHARRKDAGQLRLLQLASFREKKGHLDTIGAFASAIRDCPNIHLTLAGASPGPILDQVTAEIDRRNLAAHVTLMPGIALDALHGFMRDYDVFIHPSRHAADGDCEGGAPIVLLDAQATGMPVIATRHCDIPQEVVDGVTGILTEEGDVEGLADAIRVFHEMPPETYLGYAAAARRHVECHFDVRDCATHMESLYRVACGTNQSMAGDKHAP